MIKNKIYFFIQLLLFLLGVPFLTVQSQNLIINNRVIHTGHYIFYSPGTITSPDTSISPVTIDGDAQVTYVAGQSIFLLDSFNAGVFIDSGSFIAFIDTMPPAGCPKAIITGNHSFCSSGTTQLSAATSGNGGGTISSYQWQRNGKDIPGATNVTYAASLAGDYTVVIANSFNCTVISNVFTLIGAPCNVMLNLKIFLQGYYIGGGTMQNTLFAQGGGAPHDPADVDSITISAMDAFGTHNLVNAQVAILKTNGDVTVNFGPAVIANSPYYIKVNHSNSVETWSATAITLPPVAFYSFALDSSQAFASNEAMFEDVNGPDGNAKIYAADINQDGAVDGSDFLVLDPDIQAGAGGYIVTDVNGDGAVDGSDFLVFDPNSQDGRGIITPP